MKGEAIEHVVRGHATLTSHLDDSYVDCRNPPTLYLIEKREQAIETNDVRPQCRVEAIGCHKRGNETAIIFWVQLHPCSHSPGPAVGC